MAKPIEFKEFPDCHLVTQSLHLRFLKDDLHILKKKLFIYTLIFRKNQYKWVEAQMFLAFGHLRVALFSPTIQLCGITIHNTITLNDLVTISV